MTDSAAYEHDGDVLTRAKAIGERYALRFRAGDVHRERTGVHARLEVVVNGVVLAWGVVNTDKDEDRVRLANSAGKQLNNGHGEIYPNAFLKKDLDDFCRGLWDAELAALEPRYVGGLPQQAPTLLLEPFIIKGGGTVLFAPPGRGKSWTTLLWAVSIDAGVSTLWPVQQARTLIVNLERSDDSVRRRLGDVNAVLGLPRMRDIALLTARGRSLSDILPAVRRFVQREQIEFVLLDSISRAGIGDLTENLAANRIIDAMNASCDTWAGIAHTPRANETHLYGSVHFEAGADVVVKLASQQEENGPLGVGLEITKANDLPKFRPSVIALEMEFGRGLLVARPGRRGEFPEIERGGVVMSAADRLREWLLDQPKARATTTQAAEGSGLNRSTVNELFRHDHRFVFVTKEGRDVYYGARG